MPGRIRFGALLLAGLAALLLSTGCQHTPRRSMSEWIWPGSRDQSPEPKPVEPSVSANVALKAGETKQDVAVTEGAAIATTAKSGSEPATTSANSGPNKPLMETGRSTLIAADSPRNAGNDKVLPTNDPQVVFTDSSTDQIERLKAALDDDAERAREPDRQAPSHDARARVESLLSRARHLFDLGQLREARQAAKIAHELGDSARLDYSPDEERPIDLVQRIDDQLKETSQAAATNETAENPAAQPEKQPQQQQSKAPATTAGDSNARAKRDWGFSVFRRDRKNAPVEQTAVQAVTPQIQTSPASPGVQLGFEVDAAEAEQAVVQANRSLRLRGKGSKSSAEAAEQDEPVPSLQSAIRRAGSAPGESGGPAEEQHSAELASHQTTWASEMTEAPQHLDVDVPTQSPAEFEEVKPLKPFRDVAGEAMQVAPVDLQEDGHRFSYGWILGLIAFAVCSGVAAFWYRRGAT